MPRLKATWVVVMDASKAEFYRLSSGDSGPAIGPARPSLVSAANALEREPKSDKPGRSFGAARSGVRHAVEPRHDYHKLAKREFTRRVVAAIEEDLAAGRFGSLVMAAPKRTLGELRKLLSENVRDKVVSEIAKDLVKLAPDKLLASVTRALQSEGLYFEKKQATRAGSQAISGVGSDTTVLFRKLRRAEAVEHSIRNHADKLRKRFPRIEACKATVEGSHAHHRKGKLYRVTVFLRTPGSTLTVNSAGARGPGHEDVFAAIRDAFDAAHRSLNSYVRRRSSRSQAERSSSLQASRADAI